MKKIEKLTDNKFLNIKQIFYPEMNVRGYQFAERRGINSIAFICYDKKTGRFLLNREYKPPVDAFIDGAFGGSLDKDVSNIDIVLDEIKEEAGYNIDRKQVSLLGISFVSTQMNQYCYLYIAFVYDGQYVGRKPENAIEEMAQTVWKTEEEIIEGDDWKAIAIICKAKKMGLIGEAQ